MKTLKCSSCGKEMPPIELDESDDVLEGFILRNLPEPSAVFCNQECLERGKPNKH